MIFLILVGYLASKSASTLAVPTNLDSTRNDSEAVIHLRLSEDFFDERNLWDICWSCFATLFTWTWIAIYPNISSPRDSELRNFLRRLIIMGYMILIPEL